MKISTLWSLIAKRLAVPIHSSNEGGTTFVPNAIGEVGVKPVPIETGEKPVGELASDEHEE